MIITKLMGGHSNQLFQYAAGRQLAYKHKVPLRLDLSWYEVKDGTTTPRHYELDCYPLVATIAKVIDLARIVPPDFKPSVPRRLVHKFARRIKIRTLQETRLDINKAVLSAPDNTYLSGFWQNEGYFIDIRESLIKELETTTPLTKKNREYLKSISNCEAVSLHVRREDYVTNKVYNSFHGLAPIEYYTAAVDKIKKLHKNKILRLFVFSTDIAWCKHNLRFDCPITFVEGNKNGSDDMNLMKHCKHNIMANSSFSWWGAWLNQNPDKTVIAPKTWFKDKKANEEMEIIPESWIRL